MLQELTNVRMIWEVIVLKTETAKIFLCVGLAMIISAYASDRLFTFLFGIDFSQNFLLAFWSVNILLIMIGTIFVFAGLRNIWVNAKNRGLDEISKK